MSSKTQRNASSHGPSGRAPPGKSASSDSHSRRLPKLAVTVVEAKDIPPREDGSERAPSVRLEYAGVTKTTSKLGAGLSPAWKEEIRLRATDTANLDIKLILLDGEEIIGTTTVCLLPSNALHVIATKVDAWYRLANGANSVGSVRLLTYYNTSKRGRRADRHISPQSSTEDLMKAVKETENLKVSSPKRSDKAKYFQRDESARNLMMEFARAQAQEASDQVAQKAQQARDTINKSWEISGSEIEFQEEIGEGTSATVFRGEYRNQKVAVKVLKEKMAKKEQADFEKEFELMSSLRSPNVVFFYGVCFHPQTCIVLEWCERGSLHSYLTTNICIKWDEVLRIARETCRCLSVLHSWKPQIVHRDMKSQNLLLTNTRSVKICDFGLARATEVVDGETGVVGPAEGGADQGGMSTLGKLRGTYQYTAPEVYFGKTYTTKADIFSTAVILWELVQRAITGKYEQPFAEFPHLVFDFQVLIQVAKNNLRPTLPKNTPDHFRAVINRCWDTEPDKRPEVGQLLEAIDMLEKEYLSNKEEWDSIITDPSLEPPVEQDA
eukprot:TRINITY_DN8720_c0_g1_i1.p1 TRINITY_DN8720_c0_g1~~TRINITY_DN8720_c0_g1_i1.p1  ORF type:complete len:552 (+),score=95.39 TRINITY_DN8720_c0_g1_i1:402-2057(+)